MKQCLQCKEILYKFDYNRASTKKEIEHPFLDCQGLNIKSKEINISQKRNLAMWII